MRDWVELLRLPALFTVPGDALAGAATMGRRPGRRTLLALGSSLCLYEAGMALNDWADRAEDAAERPHRPLPSGRIAPSAALGAAAGLTCAGLALAARAGRPALTAASALAGTVWAYDLHLKHTPAGPAAMAAARGLDLLLGAAATSGRITPALPSAATLATHTLAVTAVSRQETRGGSTATPLGALATTLAVARVLVSGAGDVDRSCDGGGDGSSDWGQGRARGPEGAVPGHPEVGGQLPVGRRPLSHPLPTGRRVADVLGLPRPSAVSAVLATTYAATAARPFLHAALNPSPQLTQRAVGGGIRAMIPLQAALAARAGSVGSALATAALAPLARRFARRVSIT